MKQKECQTKTHRISVSLHNSYFRRALEQINECGRRFVINPFLLRSAELHPERKEEELFAARLMVAICRSPQFIFNRPNAGA